MGAWWLKDQAEGRSGVALPDALERKYPRAGHSWPWFWVFAQHTHSTDPRSGVVRRHHWDDQTFQQVRSGTIQFSRTKSGKARAVPIEAGLELGIVRHHEEHGTGNRGFQSAWSAFREGVEHAEIELPMGQMAHLLRHTFASHFMMAGGQLLALQGVLVHQGLTMTIGYAHLAPDHLKEARTLIPLTLCRRIND